MLFTDNMKALMDNLEEGVYAVDRDRRIIYWNPAAETLTGFTAEEVIGSRCSDNILIHVDSLGRELCVSLCPLAAAMGDSIMRTANVFLHHKQGHRVGVNVKVLPLLDLNGDVAGGIEIFIRTDSCSRVRELEDLALMDPLTALPNRRRLEGAIEAQYALYKRTGTPFGIVFIDLDNMKEVNDSCGHDTGDRLLRTFARTLKGCARPFDVLGRWGGDEFLGVLPDCDLTGAVTFGKRLCMLAGHMRVMRDRDPMRTSISVGAASIRHDDSTASLVKRADSKMYTVKQNGGNGVLPEIHG